MVTLVDIVEKVFLFPDLRHTS